MAEAYEEEIIPEIDSTQIPISPVSSKEPTHRAVNKTRDIDVGVIEKIVLKNFMCHKHCEVDLDSNINFIIGRNGSGKSAIMTGIVTGLGGKASSTQRANNLSNLIRTGSNEAEIILVLRNNGVEAFKPDEYGKTITVIRQIKRDGGGGYKLKSSSGRIIASTKEELTRMLDHFNIQVNNPVSMLSQDTSRNFLHSSQPSAKYKLFMKGTHLDQIAQDYAKAEEQQKLMNEEIKRKMSLLPDLESKAKELEEEVKQIGCLDNLEMKLSDLYLEMSWAIVKKSETRAENAAKDVRNEEKKLSKLEDRLVKIREKQESMIQERDNVKKELEGVQNEAGAVEKEREELSNKKQEVVRLLTSMKSKGTGINRQIEKIKAEKKAFEDKLNECRNQDLQELEGERKQLAEQKTELERQLFEKRGKLENARKDKTDKEELLKEREKDIRQSRSEVQRCREQINECEETLRTLQSAGSNSLRVFGPWMSDIVRSIERNTNLFRKLPKGPIGSYVKVKEQSWCCAIEVAIGFSSLIGFVVDNQADGDLLRDLIKRVLSSHHGKPHPSVFTSRFDGRVYDVSRNTPHCSYPTVMSMIEVSDPDVMNMLIDMCSVETTILIRNKTEARSVMGDVPPRNARNAYTIEGDQALPNHRYYSNKRTRPMGILQASVQEGILQQKRCLEELEVTMRNVMEADERLDGSVSLIKRDYAKINDYISREQRKVRELEGNIDELKVRLEEINSTDQEEDIATWEGVVRDLDEKLVGCRKEFNTVKAEMSANIQRLKEREQLEQEHEQHVQSIARKLQDVRRRIKDATDELDKIGHAHRIYEERVEKCRGELHDKKGMAKRLAEEAAVRAEQTAELGERVDTERTVDSIESERKNIKRTLEREKGRRANHEEIKRKYLEAFDSYKATEESIIQHTESYKKLQTGLQLRIYGYEDMRRRIANRARLFFQNTIQQRGYQGTLKFDIKEGKLEIIVKVDKNQATKNISSLSGGERSFSTVSFVMALWEAIESPFRCLDEFDVFMDLMNRKISMQLMLREAKILNHRQFIFFTPQDMSGLGIRLGDYKVLQLQAPDRSQSTLDSLMED